MINYQADAERTANTVGKAYHAAGKYLAGEAGKVAKSFADTFDLSQAEADRILATLPTADTIAALKAAAGKITDPEKKRRCEALISSPAYAYRMDRLKAVSDNAGAMCERLYRADVKQSRAFFGKEIDKAYKNAIFDIQKARGVTSAFDVMPQSRVNRILSTPWSGQQFSARVWGSTKRLADGLRHDMLAGILAGKSEINMGQDIMNRMGVGAYEARRLVRTETTYIANAAELDGYKQCDIEKYEFSACLDSRTSDICRDLDGKVFKVSDAKAGTNLPPLHPFCRSTTLPVLPSEEELDRENEALERELAGDVDFDTWLDGLVERDGKWVYEGVDKSAGSGIIFEKAESIEEAEAFVSRYVDENQFGALGVSYKGLDISAANEINETISAVYETYDLPMLGGVYTPALNSREGKLLNGAHAGYLSVRKTVLINKSTMKTPKIAADCFSEENALIRDIINNPRKYDLSKMRITARKVIENSVISGRSTVPENIKEAIWHELGHVMEQQLKNSESAGSIFSAMAEWAPKISGYAATEKSEYIAESFCSYMKGEEIEPMLMKFFESRRRV